MEERSHHGWGDLEGGVMMSKETTEIQGIVEIGQKPIVARSATARGRLNLQPETKAAIIGGTKIGRAHV